MQKRNKFQRVRLPQQFGLNAENSVLVARIADLQLPFIKERNNFSVRTYYPEQDFKEHLSTRTPHLVTTTKSNFLKKAPGLLKQGLHLIVGDKIDAKDAKFKGCIWISDNFIRVEISDGPGTVRMVTNEGKIDRAYEFAINHHVGLPEVDCCVNECRKTELRNVIFEFSYYNIPVGWRNEYFICWEITDDGTSKCHLFKER